MPHATRTLKTEIPTPSSNWYVIQVGAHFDSALAGWFGDLTIANLEGGEAELVGFFPDQAALFGALVRLRDLGIPLISVNPAERLPRHARRRRIEPR